MTRRQSAPLAKPNMTGRLMLFALAVAATPAVAGSPEVERQAALLYLLRQDCGSCHGMSLKGGLGASLLPEALADKPDEALQDTILNGRPGTPMPPWRDELSESDAAWLVLRLRKGLAP